MREALRLISRAHVQRWDTMAALAVQHCGGEGRGLCSVLPVTSGSYHKEGKSLIGGFQDNEKACLKESDSISEDDTQSYPLASAYV